MPVSVRASAFPILRLARRRLRFARRPPLSASRRPRFVQAEKPRAELPNLYKILTTYFPKRNMMFRIYGIFLLKCKQGEFFCEKLL